MDAHFTKGLIPALIFLLGVPGFFVGLYFYNQMQEEAAEKEKAAERVYQEEMRAYHSRPPIDPNDTLALAYPVAEPVRHKDTRPFYTVKTKSGGRYSGRLVSDGWTELVIEASHTQVTIKKSEIESTEVRKD